MTDRPPSPLPADRMEGGLQHERTSLAWERTAIAMVVAGTVLARYAVVDAHFVLGSAGLIEAVAGGVLFYWASQHRDVLHSQRLAGAAVPQVRMVRLVGAGTVVFTGLALFLAVLILFVDR